jgi:2-isopropylmalate synthase
MSSEINSPYMPYINPNKFGQPNLERLLLFDTTLRDGEQTPGAALSPEEKAHLSRFIYSVGFDAMEVSFGISDPNEIKATHQVITSVDHERNTSNGRDVLIYSLSRIFPEDIDAAWEAVKPARVPGIHTFVSTSDEHRLAKFPGMTQEDIKKGLAEAAGYAAEKLVKSGRDGMVEISAEDAMRTPIEFLVETYQAVMQVIRPYFGRVGFTFNIPDTVGVVVNPKKYANYIRTLRANIPDIDKVILSAHIHNDHGLAVASSLAGIEEGVRQIEGTINGIGERAGNTSLDQVAMILAHDVEKTYGLKTGVNTRKIYAASIEVAGFTGYHPSRNQPVVGSNARSHEAGIHQHGQLMGIKRGSANTYEGVSAEEVGAEGSRFPLGRRSGAHALEYHLELMGYKLRRTQERKWDADERKRVYDAFLAYATDQRTVTHSELRDLMRNLDFESKARLPLEYLGHSRFIGSDIANPEGAIVKLRVDEGPEQEYIGYGMGEVEAVVNGMRKAVGNNITLKRYMQGNRDTLTAQGERSYARTEMVLQDSKGRFIFGEGYDFDIGKSAAKAFANAWNLDLLVTRYESNMHS